MNQKSDEELMIAFAQQDQKAFEELYARHKDALYRYYLRHVSNDSIAQELFQDLWVNIIKNKEKYKVTAKFKTWIYTLARNRLIDWYRRNNLEIKSIDRNNEDEIEGTLNWNPEDEFQTKRLAKDLKYAIGKLPFEQREVFLLHQEALLTLPQIAEMLQEGLEKIKSRYRYAINKLRTNLGNTQ